MTTECDEMLDDNKSAVPGQVSVDNLTAIDDTQVESVLPRRETFLSELLQMQWYGRAEYDMY